MANQGALAETVKFLDLTLPKLRQRWGTAASPKTPPPGPRVSRAERVEALRQAATATQAAAEAIRRTVRTEPQQAQATAQAAADVLTSLAYAVEGERRGPLYRASEVFDRAARDLYGRVARATSRSQQMRAMARPLAASKTRIDAGLGTSVAPCPIVRPISLSNTAFTAVSPSPK